MVIALYYASGNFKTVFKVPSQLWENLLWECAHRKNCKLNIWWASCCQRQNSPGMHNFGTQISSRRTPVLLIFVFKQTEHQHWYYQQVRYTGRSQDRVVVYTLVSYGFVNHSRSHFPYAYWIKRTQRKDFHSETGQRLCNNCVSKYCVGIIYQSVVMVSSQWCCQSSLKKMNGNLFTESSAFTWCK